MTLPLADDGAAGQAEARVLFPIHDLVVPGHLSGFHVERDDVQVGGVQEDVSAIDRDVPLDEIQKAFLRLGQLPRIFPQQVARHCIQSLDVIAGAVHEDHAIVDQRRGFIGARK